jgi:hypothetical protein
MRMGSGTPRFQRYAAFITRLLACSRITHNVVDIDELHAERASLQRRKARSVSRKLHT